MKSAFRTTLLAAALAASAGGVLAAPVVLDFEALGQAALTALAPVAVTTVSGFNFSGAFAYEFDMLDERFDNQPFPSNLGGFLINRDRSAVTSSIVVSLEELGANLLGTAALPGSAYPGQFFKAISFQLFTAGQTPTMTAYNAAGKSWTTELTPGDGNKFWSFSPTYEFNSLDQIERLEFSAGGSVLGLDDLRITLTDAIPTPEAPEPAGFALVGLALLAAGAASRRRR